MNCADFSSYLFNEGRVGARQECQTLNHLHSQVANLEVMVQNSFVFVVTRKTHHFSLTVDMQNYLLLLFIIDLFTLSPRGVEVSNHRYISSSGTRVNAGVRRWKLNLPESTLC
jgi:hypothetical protein